MGIGLIGRVSVSSPSFDCFPLPAGQALHDEIVGLIDPSKDLFVVRIGAEFDRIPVTFVEMISRPDAIVSLA